MLLVDRILEISEDRTRCRGLKNVTMNEPFFQGHYPGNPIMPGVLIVEAMAQCGAAIILMNDAYAGFVPLIGAIDAVKFKRMVTPGDQLVMDVEVLWLRGTIGKVKAQATVEGELAASMEMTFKLLPKDK